MISSVHRQTLFPLSLLLILLTVHPSLGLYYAPYEIRDLEQAVFYEDADYWTPPSGTLNGYIITNCAGTLLIGGYGVLSYNRYLRRIYDNIKTPHTSISFILTAWILDTWDGGDFARFYFDSQWFNTNNYYYGNFPYYICGRNRRDLGRIEYYGRVAHSASTLTFSAYHFLDQNSYDESFGISSLTMLFTQNAGTAITECHYSDYYPPNSSPYTTCSCARGRFPPSCNTCDTLCNTCFAAGASSCYDCNPNLAYFDGASNACVACHASCIGCYGPSNTECRVCANGYYSYQKSTCIPATSCVFPLKPDPVARTCSFFCSPGLYLYWDLGCEEYCRAPLIPSSIPTVLGIVYNCTYPCHPTAEHLYWDSTCLSTCPVPPLISQVIRNRNYCIFSCQNPAFPIVYWDGTCTDQCLFPLQQETDHAEQFCRYPCGVNDYLYSNGSCFSDCTPYFIRKVFKQRNFCNYPCNSGQYLYSNGSCLATCDYPFYDLIMMGEKYCYYPCKSSEWLYTNDSCIATCDWRFMPRIMVGEQYCDYPCPNGLYLYLDGTCRTSCRHYFDPWQDLTSRSLDWYCDNPCVSKFMYNNGTCSTTCDSRFVSTLEGVDKICKYPCKPSEYLYKNGTCHKKCGFHFIPNTYGDDMFCDYPCTSPAYLYYNGSCITPCPTPFKPLIVGTERFCGSPCKTNDYLYKNNTCVGNCPSIFTERFFGADAECLYPCLTAQYLLRNGSCYSSCPPYFISNIYGITSERYCDFPCLLPGDYLHQNGSCLSSCHPLFTEEIYGNYRYCNKPCQTGEFLYWNGSCLPSCQPPLQQAMESTQILCIYPCSTDESLYWNGTCLPSCDFPLIPVIEADRNYCTYPCASTEYLAWDGSCLSSCSYPFRIRNEGMGTLCLLPCDNPDDYFYEYMDFCKSYCDQNSTLQDGLYRKCFPLDADEGAFIRYLSTSSAEPGSITLIALSKMIQYTKYLSIPLPPRLQRFNRLKGTAPLSLKYITTPLTLPEKFEQELLPGVFFQYDTPSSFIVNFWSELMFLSIIIGITVFLVLCELFFKAFGYTSLPILFERLRIIFCWNFIIMFLAMNIDYILFYTALDAKTLHINSAASFFSFFLGIIFSGLVCSIIVGTCLLVVKFRHSKQQAFRTKSFKSYIAFLTKWQSLQVLFRGFKQDGLLIGMFYAIYTIRMALPMLISSYLYTIPFLQTIIYTLISFTITLFILNAQPLKKKVNHIQLSLMELLVLVANSSILGIEISNYFEFNNYNTRVLLGDIVILCNLGINLIPLIFLPIKAALIIKAAGVFNNNKIPISADQRLRSLLPQLIFLPLQQLGFGFEQVQVVRFAVDEAVVEENTPLKNLGTQEAKSENDIKDSQSNLSIEESRLEGVTNSFPIRRIARKKMTPFEL